MKTAYGLPKKREEVANVLQAAFSEGNLDEAEYERRLEEVYAAESIEALKKTLSDFPLPIQMKLFPPGPMGSATTAQRTVAAQPSTAASYSPIPIKPVKVIMGDQQYVAPSVGGEPFYASNFLGNQRLDLSRSAVQAHNIRIHAECLLGSTEINLLNPELADKQIDLYLHGALGEVKILVPKSVQVTREIQVIMGEFSYRKKYWNPFAFFKSTPNDTPDMDFTFQLTIHGSFFLGSVHIVQYGPNKHRSDDSSKWNWR